MVLVLEKPPLSMRPAPPPYIVNEAANPPPFPNAHKVPTTLASLSPALLLKIVYSTFPQLPDRDRGKMERQRMTLYWLNTSLRLVNRSLYIACMHVLRSTYLPAYNSLIRPPHSSDPFPHATTDSTSYAITLQSRETKVLDLFISLKVREDVYMDDSELHLEREESFKDLFDLMQPKARMEDLVRIYGLREGVLYMPDGQISSRSSKRLPFANLSVSFTSRKAGLILSGKGSKRTIVEVARTRDEKLEYAAKRLVQGIKSTYFT